MLILFLVITVLFFHLLSLIGRKKSESNVDPDVQTINPEGLKPLLEIRYSDVDDHKTTRKIWFIRDLISDDLVYIRAYCFKKNDLRTFRSDRILEAVDLHTGEVIEDINDWLFNFKLRSR
jgi:hypothetical protein